MRERKKNTKEREMSVLSRSQTVSSLFSFIKGTDERALDDICTSCICVRLSEKNEPFFSSVETVVRTQAKRNRTAIILVGL